MTSCALVGSSSATAMTPPLPERLDRLADREAATTICKRGRSLPSRRVVVSGRLRTLGVASCPHSARNDVLWSAPRQPVELEQADIVAALAPLRQISENLADDTRKLEAVPRAGRCERHLRIGWVQVDHKVPIGRVRKHTRF